MNFKSQKGATGADLVFAITIIVFTIAVVSMIYVNTTFQGRNVTRTAGATRIATNILENIEKIDYNDFVQQYGTLSSSQQWEKIVDNENEYKDYYQSNSATEIFNTKIPKGYTVYIYGEPVYGSHTNPSEQFDLVREIKLAVTYNVGDKAEKVDFTTTKTREIINEVNPPDINVLARQGGILSGGKKFYPIKYYPAADVYLKTTEEDPEWYSYSNKAWAIVIVPKSNESESDLFDINGKLIADSSHYTRYAWIPRFFYTTNTEPAEFSEFAYLLTDAAIKEVARVANDEVTELKYTTYANRQNNENTEATDMGNFTGIWIEATSTAKIEENAFGKILNRSNYGPCEF